MAAAAAIATLGALPASVEAGRRVSADALIARLHAIDGRLAGALAATRDGTLPNRFDRTIISIQHDVVALGHALPEFDGLTARGSVVYYGLRDAHANLALARKHVRAREPGTAKTLRAASRDLGTVARELARDGSLSGVSGRFRALADRAVAMAAMRTPADDDVRAIMAGEERLLPTLPAVAGVPFATFYAQSGIVHARVGHALRTTLHNEPEAVRADLVGARQAARQLAATFRAAQ